MQNCGEKGLGLRRITGSHHIYENLDVDQILSIPVHRNKDLKIGTLRTLMKVAELSEDDLL
jgi:predicted RNA binding protein YcfA (HicA-like mRNA interferase family)